jgi:hypothetical protein
VPLVLPLVALDVLALVLWTVAVALAIALIIRKIGAVFAPVPVVGGYISGALGDVATAIANAAGSLESGIDSLMGAAWHALASYMDRLWHHIEAEAALSAQQAELLGGFLYRHLGIQAAVRSLEQDYRGIEHGVKDLTREWHGLEAEVRKLAHDLTHGIGDDVLPRLKQLDREVTKIDDVVLPKIRAEVAGAEADIAGLRKWIADNFPAIGTAALTTAIAWALSQLGLGGLRCSSLTNMLGKRGCGLWKDLEGLLGLFADTVLLTNVCDLLPVLETAVSDVATPIVVTLTDVGAGLCSGGIGAPPALTVPALSLPATVSDALNLP